MIRVVLWLLGVKLPTAEQLDELDAYIVLARTP